MNYSYIADFINRFQGEVEGQWNYSYDIQCHVVSVTASRMQYLNQSNFIIYHHGWYQHGLMDVWSLESNYISMHFFSSLTWNLSGIYRSYI